MFLEKFSRVSMFTGQVVSRKLDVLLKATSISPNRYNPHCSCKNALASYTYNQMRHLNAFSDLRYLQVEVKPLPKKSLHYEQQYGGNTLLESSDAYANSVPKPMTFNESQVVDNLEELLNKSWISMSNSEIIDNFECLSHYSFKHGEVIQDQKFSGILEVLKSRCTDFSDSDIRHLLKCLQLWKVDKEQEAFVELWKSFESEIMKRFPDWTIDEILHTCHLYYKLKISRSSEFTFHSLKKIGKKPQKMSQTQLVHFTFLMKMNRRLPINLYNIEYYFEQNADNLTLSELGIFTMAFSQYETPIRSPVFIEKILDKLIAGNDTLDEMSLNSIINAIRVHRTTSEKFLKLLEMLEEDAPKLSNHTLVTAAKMQKKTLMVRNSFMYKIFERCEKDITDLNIKSIDTLMLSLMTLGYNPEKVPFIPAAFRELLNPSRADEFEKFPKTFINIIHSALVMNYFSPELEEICKKIFNLEFVDKFCKNDYYYLNREYLEMNYCLELEQPEYSGPTLDKEIIHYLCKTFGSFNNEKTTRRSERDTFDGKILNDVERICKNILKSESLFYRDAILPYCSKAYGIVCYDPETKEFGSPGEKLSQIPWHMLKYAPGDGRKWFALVTLSVHQIVNNTKEPVGKTLMRMRHLEKIGYEPVVIPYYVWDNFAHDDQKEKYLLNILQR